jgi:hypothetical protein
MTKTNAIRLLEAANVKFTAREYDVSDGEISGIAVVVKKGLSHISNLKFNHPAHHR